MEQSRTRRRHDPAQPGPRGSGNCLFLVHSSFYNIFKIFFYFLRWYNRLKFNKLRLKSSFKFRKLSIQSCFDKICNISLTASQSHIYLHAG